VPDAFDSTLYAYCVAVSDDWFIINPQQLMDSNPVDYFTVNSKEYVSLRYAVTKPSQ
jgi:hypothetical protein